MSNDKDYNDNVDDDVEEYEISNILNYFKSNNISVNGIFTFEGRTVFILIQYQNTGLELFIYIPSKFYIKPDHSIKNYFHINLKMEEKDEDDTSVPNIFSVNKNNTVNEILKQSMEGSLKRFVPLFEDLSFKLVYANKEILSYINRYNSVETFIFSNPFNRNGYYYMLDLEKFYGEGKDLEKSLSNTETLLYTKVYNVFDGEIPKLYNLITDISVDVKKFSGKSENSKHNERMSKIKTVMNNNISQGKGIGDCIKLIGSVRDGNLKNIFYMEKVIQFLKEIEQMK